MSEYTRTGRGGVGPILAGGVPHHDLGRLAMTGGSASETVGRSAFRMSCNSLWQFVTVAADGRPCPRESVRTRDCRVCCDL